MLNEKTVTPAASISATPSSIFLARACKLNSLDVGLFSFDARLEDEAKDVARRAFE